MAYHLCASKLQAYQRCPQAYYFRYERGLPTPGIFASAALGTALHRSLAEIYGEWHYLDPIPRIDWIEDCWDRHSTNLTAAQIEEGREILGQYYHRFIAHLSAMHKPLAVEGKIKGNLHIRNLEFVVSGRYDRLDWLDDGLELIDYKSSRHIQELPQIEVDLQLGLYYLALEQKYGKSLKYLSLIYLRSGEALGFDVTPRHQQLLEFTIGELAMRLRLEREWEPVQSEQCDRCPYSRYCPAMQPNPEPLPADAKPERQLQLSLGF